MEKLTYTVSEAAEAVGVSKPIMYNLVNADNCSFAFRVGRKIIISKAALEQWIIERSREAAERGL